MTIQQIQNQLVEDFSFFDDWTQRYEYLIELGKSLPLIDPQYKTPERLIKGCQSQVWLYAESKEGKLYFTADSDAIITKGIVAFFRTYTYRHPNGRHPFHRPDRSQRTLVAHSCQWPSQYASPDACLCTSRAGQKLK